MDHIYLYLLGRQLQQRIAQGFHRTIHITFDNQVKFFEITDGQASSNFIQCYVFAGTHSLLSHQLLTLVADFASRRFALGHIETLTSGGSSRKAKNLNRLSRANFCNLLTPFVLQNLDTSIMSSCQNRIPGLQGPGLDEDGGNNTPPFVQGGFNNGSNSSFVGVGLKFKDFGFQKDFFEEQFHIQPLFGRDFLVLVFSTPAFNQNIHGRQLLSDFLGVGLRPVNLVNGKNHGHTGRLRVADGLFGLGHHLVVGRNDNDDNVGDFGTPSTHRRKSFVARCIQKGNVFVVGKGHFIGTDVLRDTPRFAGNHIGLADIVKQ